MSLARATFSIDPVTLEKFNRLVPAGQRSQVVERLIAAELEARSARLAAAAAAVENDPDLAEVRADIELWQKVDLSADLKS